MVLIRAFGRRVKIKSKAPSPEPTADVLPEPNKMQVLERAQTALMSGTKSPRQVWEETGWGQDKTGEWRVNLPAPEDFEAQIFMPGITGQKVSAEGDEVLDKEILNAAEKEDNLAELAKQIKESEKGPGS